MTPLRLLPVALLSLSTAARAGEVPPPNLHVGDSALLFSLPAINEDAALRAVMRPHVALADFTGVLPGFPARVVVVHFTQKANDPDLLVLDRLQKKHGARGLRVLAISASDGDLASASSWVQSQHLDVPVLRDAHRIVVDRYGVRAYPMTFIIDAEGYIDAIGMPGADLEQAVDALVAPFLKPSAK